ncbi:hypothetical protein N7495_004223 [Penicillium taxi]|uniref:uncharacterized protein n=1 Tax=Penicillium taxi TaxID=168475 RepID=UPI002545921E|nr:uncharacterized protein N7495_004223 [Penicillium taxi]KAJ5899479.1 hypothetical protein N7495_004223 [Penicillium taxi]
MDSAPQEKWKCDECSSTFTRLDHLKRHLLTRSRLQSGQDIPGTQRGGKHKRACDSCAGLRKACSGTNPCAECDQRGRLCTYERLLEYGESSSFVTANSGEAVRLENQGMDIDTQHAATISAKEPETQNNEMVVGEQPTWSLGPQSFYPSAIKTSTDEQQLALEDRDNIIDSPKWDLGPSSFYPPMSTWPRRP